MAIQIRAFFGPWRDVDAEQARGFVRTMMGSITAIPEAQRAEYIEAEHLRGVTVAELMGAERC